MTFGEVVSEARRMMGTSQRELAMRIVKEDGSPISAQYLNDIERDRRNPPGDQLMDQFARELKLDKDNLYYLAGKLPFDVRDRASTPRQVREAFKAFRQALRDERLR